MTPDIIAWLLNDLHAELSIGLKPEDRSRLTANPPQTVEALGDAILIAEGLDPERETDRREQMVTRMHYALVETQ